MKTLAAILAFLIISLSTYAQVIQPDAEILDSLRTELENILIEDQTFRRIYTQAEEVLGVDSYEMEYFWQVVEAQDKRLEKRVTEIIDKYGWLGISQVGRRANTALWAVLQHGTVASKKKYAPLLKESILKAESRPLHYAKLIDRMLINSEEPQLYGTQIDYESGDKPTFFPYKRLNTLTKEEQR